VFHGLKTVFFVIHWSLILFVNQIDFLPMTTVCGTGGDIRLCGQKQTLFWYQVVICLFILSFHFRLKDCPGRLSFSYATLLAFLFSVNKSMGSGCFFPDLDPSVNWFMGELLGYIRCWGSISMLFWWWFSTTVGEGRLWERLRIYSGKLFIAIKLNWPCSHNGNDQITIYNDYR
jgi:hypothetical protein